MADGVFQHDDRVVNQEADRQDDAHQRERVQAVARGQHQQQRADNRDRQHDAGNDGFADAAEEQEDHHHHQSQGNQDGDLHVKQGLVNRQRAVEHGFDRD